MKPVIAKWTDAAKPLLRPVARAFFSRLPAPASRLSGSLALEGGLPVRNVRLRPWPSVADRNFLDWHREARGVFRRIFLGGIEGLPQPLAREFAQQWAKYCGCQFGLLFTNGTDALRIAVAAALEHDGFEYGGEIIVPNFSFIASAAAPLDRRFGVAFVDVDPQTLLLDPKRVEEAIIPGRTRAILPVHLFGQPADMGGLRALAVKHGLKVIEDAAQAHGAVSRMGPVGSLGDVAGFSFQSSKNLACGEGGALTTNDERLFERAYSLYNCGRTFNREGRWSHEKLGLNCRTTEYQAGLLIHRFKYFDQMQAVRAKNVLYFKELLLEVGCLEPLGVDADVRAHGMHMFAMRYRPEGCGNLLLEDFLKSIQAEGAPIYRAYASTLSEQPAIQDLRKKHPSYFRVLATPVADRACLETVFIPQQIFLGTERDMEDIVAAIKKIEEHSRRTRALASV